MGQVSNADAINLFKKVYGDLKDLQPKDFMLQSDIPFSQKQKVGESYSEAVVLTAETGWTLGGEAMEAFNLNPAIAGTVKQTLIKPSMTVVPSVVPWGVMSRSAGAGEKAFFDGTKFIVKNNLKSHGKLLEVLRIHGQAPELLGYVSYATATYRGVALTNGTGTVNGVAFTNGVSASAKAILFAPGNFASGIWVGSEGCVVEQVDSTGAVVASGKMVGVDSEYGILYVDFTPVAATSTTSHRIAWQGMADGKDALGIKKILATQTGSLFGISVANYSLWKGVQVQLNQSLLTLAKLQNAVAEAVNRGGLGGDESGDLVGYVNPRSWATLVTTESAKRVYDKSYSSSEFDNGAESIAFYHQAGKLTLKSHRMIKEGDALLLHTPDWSRSGSAEASFTVPGAPQGEVIFPLENAAGYAFRSYSDQYMFCNAPAKSILITGINDEANS